MIITRQMAELLLPNNVYFNLIRQILEQYILENDNKTLVFELIYTKQDKELIGCKQLDFKLIDSYTFDFKKDRVDGIPVMQPKEYIIKDSKGVETYLTREQVLIIVND